MTRIALKFYPFFIRIFQPISYLCSMQHFAHKEAAQPEQYHDVDVLTETSPSYTIIVWNDEVNSFEWVIETLIEVCGHDQEQAEQCAMLIHSKGKYSVKKGDYDTLKPMCDAITERGIGATIEVLA